MMTTTWVRRAAAGAGLACCLVSAAAAASSYERPEERGRIVGGHFLDESFDAAAFPPAEWTYSPIQPLPYRWHRTNDPDQVRSSPGAAHIERRPDAVQNEPLFTPTLDLSAATPTDLRLSFWYRTDPFWYVPDTSFVRVHVTNDGAAWTRVWSTEDVTESGWAWRNVVVDLSSWAGQVGDFQIRIRYRGQATADFQLDDLVVGYLAPPTAPENDTCAAANGAAWTIGPGVQTYDVTADNTLATHDYPLTVGSCVGSPHDGKDLVWRIEVPADHHFTALMEPTGGWDATLFLVTNCANPQGSCVDGDRGYGGDAFVAQPNFGPGTAVYWLVASGWNQDGGEFRLSGGIFPGTSMPRTSWGRVKAAYR